MNEAALLAVPHSFTSSSTLEMNLSHYLSSRCYNQDYNKFRVIWQ